MDIYENIHKNTYINNYQILGCIDALKIINHIFYFSETPNKISSSKIQEKDYIDNNSENEQVINFEEKSSDEVIEKLIVIPEKYKFTQITMRFF